MALSEHRLFNLAAGMSAAVFISAPFAIVSGELPHSLPRRYVVLIYGYEIREAREYLHSAVMLAFMAFSAVLPFIWLRRKLEQKKRSRGRCPNCGYDLRATPERCPECGTASQTARTEASSVTRI